MSLVWCDGFEGYGSGSGVNITPVPTGVLADKYAYVKDENRMTVRNDVGEFRSGWSLRMSNPPWPTYINSPVLTSDDTLIGGIAFKAPGSAGYAASEQWPLLCFKNTANQVCAEAVCSHRTFYVKDASGAYLGGVRGVYERATFYYFEMKVYGHATEGTIDIHINGCPVFSASSVNTQAASGIATRTCIGDNHSPLSADYIRLDDFYSCDGAGSKNNDFLGDITVRSMLPDEDHSVNFATTGNSGYGSHYQQVNFGDSLRDTDWVADDTVGAQDTFNTQNLPEAYDAIHGMIAWAYAKYEVTPATYKLVIDSNGTEVKSANITCDADWHYDMNVWEDDPDIAAAWTPDTVNAVTSGFEVQ
jgi:hypothetical protein